MPVDPDRGRQLAEAFIEPRDTADDDGLPHDYLRTEAFAGRDEGSSQIPRTDILTQCQANLVTDCFTLQHASNSILSTIKKTGNHA